MRVSAIGDKRESRSAVPWGRLNDKGNDDDKLLALTDAAWRMWGCGLIYCQNKLTDGFIPEHAINTFGVRAPNKKKVAAELCSSLVSGKGPLWHKVEGGYQVHDYLDWNPSKDDVLLSRQSGKQRLEVFRNPKLRRDVRTRDCDCCRYCGVPVQWHDRRGLLGGTYDHVNPSGGSDMANVVVACRGCNSRKGRRTPEQAGMALRPVPDLDQKTDTASSDLDQTQPDLDLKQGYQVPRTTDPEVPRTIRDPRTTSESEKAAPAARLSNQTLQDNPDDNVAVITALVTKELIPFGIPYDHLLEATKSLCAKRQIAYNSQAVRKAVDSATFRARLPKRVGFRP